MSMRFRNVWWFRGSRGKTLSDGKKYLRSAQNEYLRNILKNLKPEFNFVYAFSLLQTTRRNGLRPHLYQDGSQTLWP